MMASFHGVVRICTIWGIAAIFFNKAVRMRVWLLSGKGHFIAQDSSYGSPTKKLLLLFSSSSDWHHLSGIYFQVLFGNLCVPW